MNNSVVDLSSIIDKLFVNSVLDRGWVGKEGQNKREIVGAINKEEAATLASLIIQNNCKKTFETGVANGISTLAIAQAVSVNGGHHYGIDPCQYSQHQGVTFSLLDEFQLRSDFTLCHGPAHLEIPKLIESGQKFDFCFIDGMHKFDYKFVDFFLSDRLLKIGGIIAFHDILLPSTKKVHRFMQRMSMYENIPTPLIKSPNLYHQFKYIVAACIKRKSYWYSWPNGFRNLLVLRKIDEPEQPWDFYKHF